jgi:hypothetical protein
MSGINWSDRYYTQLSPPAPSSLASLKATVAASLLSAGTAYDSAGSADAAAAAAYTAALNTWTGSYQSAFQTVDRSARYTNSLHGGPVLTAYPFATDANSYAAVRARGTAALALSGMTSTQTSALNAAITSLDSLWGSPPAPLAAATQPGTLASLNAALAAANDLIALLNFA